MGARTCGDGVVVSHVLTPLGRPRDVLLGLKTTHSSHLGLIIANRVVLAVSRAGRSCSWSVKARAHARTSFWVRSSKNEWNYFLIYRNSPSSVKPKGLRGSRGRARAELSGDPHLCGRGCDTCPSRVHSHGAPRP